jgi:hypothetical protein
MVTRREFRSQINQSCAATPEIVKRRCDRGLLRLPLVPDEAPPQNWSLNHRCCMKRLRLIVVAGSLAGLTSCAYVDPAPSTAVMPQGALGTNGDIDVRSLDIAAYSFGHVIRNPAEAADAIAALDYVGGELNTSPRWIGMDPLTRAQMLQARETLRSDIGISQAAPSQAVVDTMLALSRAYRSGDAAGVQRLLGSSIFIVPPAEVQAHLADIPLMPAINNVTTRADAELPDFNTPS